VGRIPIGQLTPGSYELRAAVRQGGTTVGQSVLFRVTD
jgi:hypothetical protein